MFDNQPTGGTNPLRMSRSIAGVAAEAERRTRYVRVVRASVLVLFMVAVGTYGYWSLTDGEYGLMECLYMTVVTVSTVGFQEVIPAETDALKGFTIGLILLGSASLLYFLTAVATVIIEGDIAYRMWHRRVARRLRALRGHVVVCGVGRTGAAAALELWQSRRSFVVVDTDPHRIEALLAAIDEKLLFVVGDVFEEGVLRSVRTGRAAGVITALPDDRANLLACVTVRQMSPDAKIVAKLEDPRSVAKFEAVGADAVDVPTTIGGRRLAAELVRPELVRYTDAVLAGGGHRRTLVEIDVAPGAVVDRSTLAQAQITEKTGCVIIGLREPDQEAYRYHPHGGARLDAGGGVLALGEPKELRRLRALLRAPTTRRSSRPGTRT